MLYLMMNKGDKTVKVGYAKRGRVEGRRAEYKTHNPLAIMRSSCAGTKDLEKVCHQRLAEMGKRISGTEWFVVDDWTFNHLFVRGMGALGITTPIHFHEEFENRG